MKIKQAEELAGITSKNIRFYEEQGLIHPERYDNGYRNYTSEDVEVLKKIKFLRKFDTSLEDIRQLFDGRISMKECLENRDDALEKNLKNIEKTRMLIKQMLDKCQSIEQMDTDFWLDKVENMEKEGADFVDLKRTDIHRKKRNGAIAGAGVMILFVTGFICIDIWVLLTEPEFPLGIFLFMLVPALTVGTGIIVAMTKRIKEIEKGEEDEASKY